LKANLTDELDYTLVPKAAWDLLVSWYGLAEEQVRNCVSANIKIFAAVTELLYWKTVKVYQQ